MKIADIEPLLPEQVQRRNIMKNMAPPFTSAEPDEAVKKVRKHNARRGKGKKANEEKSAALLREMSARKGKAKAKKY